MAEIRLPFQSPTYCLRTPSIPVRSTSGTLGTWWTFNGTLTLILAPILAPKSSVDEEDGDCDKSEEVLESDPRATSQRIRCVLVVVGADIELQRGENGSDKEDDEEEEDDDEHEQKQGIEAPETLKPRVLRLIDDVAVAAAAVAELSNPTVALLILLYYFASSTSSSYFLFF